MNCKHGKPGRGGFTLIEIMVVLVIIAVLMATAVPSYRDSTRKSARTAARAALYDVASRQEQYFMNNKSYSGTLAGLGLPEKYAVDRTSKMVAVNSAARVYHIELMNASAAAFEVLATAQRDQAEDDCGNFSLKSDGAQAVSGVMGSLACW